MKITSELQHASLWRNTHYLTFYIMQVTWTCFIFCRLLIKNEQGSIRRPDAIIIYLYIKNVSYYRYVLYRSLNSKQVSYTAFIDDIYFVIVSVLSHNSRLSDPTELHNTNQALDKYSKQLTSSESRMGRALKCKENN